MNVNIKQMIREENEEGFMGHKREALKLDWESS